jgi:hypothetical protein
MPISGKPAGRRWRKKDHGYMAGNATTAMFITYLIFLFAAAIPAAYVLILHHYFKNME